MTELAAALGLALSIGWLLAATFLRGLEARNRWMLAAAAAVPIGLGGTGLAFLAWKMGGGRASWSGTIPELAGVVALVALTLVGARPSPPIESDARERPSLSLRTIGYAAACTGAALLVAIATAVLVREAPSGQWDAWAMWNMKGRMLAWSSDWTRALDPELAHPDYPLLLPACVGRLLGLAPGAGAAGPGAIAVLAAASTVLLPAAILFSTRGPRAALLAALLAAGGPSLPQQAASQYADVPVGLFFSTGIGLVVIARAFDDRGSALLGGVSLGLAAWTKNEGLAMAMASGIALTAALSWEGGITRIRRLGAPVLASALVLVVPLLLVRAAVPHADMAADGLAAKWVRALDPDRWRVVAAGLVSWLDPRENFAPWLLAGTAAVAGVRRGPRGTGFVLGAVTLCLAADVLAYVASPWALEWQLATSLSRVLLQLWPAAVIGAVGAIQCGERERALSNAIE